jgi:hypothetical protein
MNKTAAMNKLAVAVTEYIQAEQNYSKIAYMTRNYVMQKRAGFGDTIWNGLGNAANYAGKAVSQAGNSLASGVYNAAGNAADAMANVGQGIRDAGSSALQGAQNLGNQAVQGVQNAGNQVMNMGNQAVQGIKNMGNRAMQMGSQMGNQMAAAGYNALGGVMNAGANLGNAVRGGIGAAGKGLQELSKPASASDYRNIKMAQLIDMLPNSVKRDLLS